MSEQHKAIVRSLYKEIDRSKGIPSDDLVSPNMITHMAGAPGPMDVEEMGKMSGMFYGAFPDLQHVLADQVAEGDRVVTRLTIRGTHRGDFQGVPASGKQIEMNAIAIHRLDGGRIAEQWVHGDMMGLMQQIGAIPAPA